MILVIEVIEVIFYVQVSISKSANGLLINRNEAVML